MKKTLPYGVQDYLPDECYNKQQVENRICTVFSLCGYDRIETPTLEYYDTYAGVVDSSDRMFKLTDNDGSLLVLRPDPTLQVCRMAGKMNASTHRLYYVSNSYEYLPDTYSARTREFAQAGVELLGQTGIDGEIEIIRLAIESLLATGLEDFLIEIGDVRYFKCLMAESGLCDADAETMQALVNRKDSLGLELFLQRKDMAPHFKQRFMMLPSLYGDVSVLTTAANHCGEQGKRVLADLQTVCDRLTAEGYGKYISVDLGLLQGIDYYSGLILRGLTKGLGQSLLDGGRYDAIGGRFKEGMHAVGFGIGIKRLLVALEQSGKLEKLPSCTYAYATFGNGGRAVTEAVKRLRQQGKRVVDSFCGTKEELLCFCRQNGIGNALFWDGNRVTTVAVEES